MQIYAYDEQGKEQISHFAEKNKYYACIECHAQVALRSGPFVRPHFYHLGKERPCKIRSKTETHLNIQTRILESLPTGQARMERSFPEIGRIADVAWESEKIIFEIQYSYISFEEIEARNRDYKKMGYQVIWILHEGRYNRRRMTAAEIGLTFHPHYYTDINKDGVGGFYDQFSYAYQGLRILRILRLPIDISVPLKNVPLSNFLPNFLKSARKNWPLYFKGDIGSRAAANYSFNPHHLAQAHQVEKKLRPPTYFQKLKKKVKRALRFIGYVILESALS